VRTIHFQLSLSRRATVTLGVFVTGIMILSYLYLTRVQVLLGNVFFAGQKGPHIYDTAQQLVDSYNRKYGGRNAFVAKTLKVLTRARRSQ
jgi:hypothetical protein